MDHYKSLYKDNSCMLSPRQLNRRNREILNANRARARRDIYFNGRDIVPTPCKSQIQQNNKMTDEIATASNSNAQKNTVVKGNKENIEISEKQADDTLLIAKVAHGSKNGEKLSHREAFLRRFIEWKDKRKQEQVATEQQRQNKRKPFVSADPGGNTTSISSRNCVAGKPAFAPKCYDVKTRAGFGVETIEKLADKVKNKRRSLYTAVPTPPRKNNTAPLCVSTAYSKPAPVVQTATRPVSARKVISSVTQNLRSAVKTPAVVSNGKTQTASNTEKVTKIILPATNKFANKTKPPPFVLPQPPAPSTTPKKTAAFRKPAAVNIVKPIRNGAPGVYVNTNTANTTNGTGGAIAKIKSAQFKRNTVKEAKNAKLANNLKSKKPINVNCAKKFIAAASNVKQAAQTKFKLNGKTLLEALQPTLPIAETPTDLVNAKNPFEIFVTSTRIKSTSPKKLNIFENLVENSISPVETIALPTQSNNKLNKCETRSSSAQRALDVQQLPKSTADKRKNKFNFVHYSGVDSDLEVEEAKLQTSTAVGQVGKQKTTANNSDADIVPLEDMNSPKTPVKENNEERPSNYLSPFVSVTRGKVSAKKEKEKRNSVYLQSPVSEQQLPEMEKIVKKTTETQGVEVRRTLETVRFFRQQLNDEIARLHSLCYQWEAYKEENVSHLQQTNGDDMINVTIGQTKLLTSKKFMQFSGLIDRCEAGALGTAAVDDGSEKTKRITTIDLEGFWSMLGLQTDNVDKRFENLERWKAHDWQDPDEVQMKTKKNLVKITKAKARAVVNKAKPSSGIQQMMRKMQAEMRKNKSVAAAAAANEEREVQEQQKNIVIKTPIRGERRTSHGGTPNSQMRKSIKVLDRKSRSVAATILTITPSPKRASLSRKQALESPKITSHLANFESNILDFQSAIQSNNLLKTTLIKTVDKQRRKSLATGLQSPLAKRQKLTSEDSPKEAAALSTLSGRKSILKTPGTAKGKAKNVIFNEKLRVKKFRFTTYASDSENDSADEDDEKSVTEFMRNTSGDGNSESKQVDVDQRSYKLRTRKVVLRPSCEFEIPK